MGASYLLGEMCEDEGSLLGQQLVLLGAELLQQLAPRDGEDGLEEAAAEHLCGLIARQAVVALRDVAVTQPPAHRRKGSTLAWIPSTRRKK